MRNSTAERKSLEETTNVEYSYKCSVDACKHRAITYIGLTTTTLRRRMQAHRNHGGIHNHFTTTHDRKPLLKELLSNTSIIHRENRTFRLNVAEAVSIALKHPVLNTQTESDYVLPSARRRATTIRRDEPAGGDAPDNAVPGAADTPDNAVPGAANAPVTIRQGQVEPKPAEGDRAAQGRTLRPRRTRPVYAE